MGIDWRTALERLHHSDMSEAKRWGMSDEQPNLLRDIVAERIAELEKENTRLREGHAKLRANHDRLLAAMTDGTGRQFYIDGAQTALDVAESVRMHATWGPKATPNDGLDLGLNGVKDAVRKFVASLTKPTAGTGA